MFTGKKYFAQISSVLLLVCLLGFALSSSDIQANSSPSDNEQLPTNFHLSRDAAYNLFKNFKKTFKKFYSVSEELKRFKNFILNLEKIESLKQANPSCRYGVNEFSDMSSSEFREKMLIAPQENHKFSEDRLIGMRRHHRQAPESFDWREHGAVTPVQNQGFSGTCWTFSTTGNISGQWFLAGNPLVELSKEQLVDCDSSTQPSTGKADCGIFGGWAFLAFDYVISVGGLPSEEDYPYCVGNGSCYPCNAPGYNTTFCGGPVNFCDGVAHPCRQGQFPIAAKIESWKTVTSDEEALKQHLFEIGPLAVSLDAEYLQYYNSGVFAPDNCSTTKLTHAVLMVGYGVDTETNEPYWIIKNSYGPDWGENGYFRIKRGVSMCGINNQATTSIVNLEKHHFEFEYNITVERE